VDDDAPPSESGRIGEVHVLGHAHPVVVDDRATLGDLDTEPVNSVAARLIAVVRDQQEPVAGQPVDRAVASVRRLPAAGDDQAPGVIHGAVEVDVSRLELEFGLTFRNVGALLVLRDEAEVRLARQGWEATGRLVDPSAARDEPSGGIVDDDELEYSDVADSCVVAVTVDGVPSDCGPVGPVTDVITGATLFTVTDVAALAEAPLLSATVTVIA